MVPDRVLHLFRARRRRGRGVEDGDARLELDLVRALARDLCLAVWVYLCDDGAGGASVLK